MTGEHVSETTLDRLARRELDPDAFLVAARHLQSCVPCAARARLRAANDLGALRRELTSAPQRASGRAWRYATAAGVAAAVVVAFFVTRDDPATPVTTLQPSRVLPRAVEPPPISSPAAKTTNYGEGEWQRLVDEATASGTLPFPVDLAELRGTRDVVRGTSGETQRIEPAGVVAEDARPTFTWPVRASKTYVVFVFDGEREIARSEELREPSWRPDRDLPRGRTLSWQVEASQGDDLETIPRPPAPPAKFRVISDRDRRDLERARALHPDDALLHAVLYARAGLAERALDALRRVPAGDATGKLLARYSEQP